MTGVTWALILAGVGLNAVAQLLLKISTRPLSELTRFDLQALGHSVGVLLSSLPFWGGMFCYALSVCVWIAALTKAPVSTAYPMLSIGYVVVACAAVFWLGESLTPSKLIGISLICIGVVLVSRNSI